MFTLKLTLTACRTNKKDGTRSAGEHVFSGLFLEFLVSIFYENRKIQACGLVEHPQKYKIINFYPYLLRFST